MNDDADRLAITVHAGERGAVERLVCTYQDALFGYALRLVGDADDAEEVVQDTFVKAHRALTRQYDEERCRAIRLRPWLYRIARNLARNRLRSRRATAARVLPEDGPLPDAALAYPPPVEGPLESEQARAMLEHALGALAPPAREVVTLRFIEEMSYAEIAAILRTSEASARGRVFRALRQLRAVLKEREVVHEG